MDTSDEQMISELMAQAAADASEGPAAPQQCPDGGSCGHRCDDVCWRTVYCVPLSGHGDEWPADTSPVPAAAG